MQSQPVSPEELATMWVKVHPHAAAFISSFVRNFSDANDILQDVATIVVRKREEYDPQKSFDAWVISIARFEVLKYRRTMARDRLQFSQDVLDKLAATHEQVQTYDEERREAMAGCFENVAGQPREVFHLRYVEGVKPAEIGRRLGITANAASAMLLRTRKSLRECIQRRLGRVEAGV